MANYFNDFWKNVIYIWAELDSHSTTAPENILSQPLWLNSDIKINKKSIALFKWINHGIFFVNDLLNDSGNFMKFEEFRNTYNIDTHFLQFSGIISAIPKSWKNLVKDVTKQSRIINGNILTLQLAKKESKTFYPKFLSLFSETPAKAKLKWEERMSDIISDDEWEKAFILPHNLTMNTKLITFQNFT